MAKKKLSNENVTTLVYAAALLVLGILFCCHIASEVIGTIIGVVFIAAGAALLLVSLIQTKGLLSGSGLLGGILVVVGIMFILGTIFGFIIEFIILAMIVMGAILIVDAILRVTLRKEKNMIAFAIELCLGVASFVLGMCLWFIPEFGAYAEIVFGVILILYAVYLTLTVFVIKGKKK